MKRKNIFALTLMAAVSLQGFAQSTGSVSGRVSDEWGNPVSGAVVSLSGNPTVKAITNRNGQFKIHATKEDELSVSTADNSFKTVKVGEGVLNIVITPADQPVNIGFEKIQHMEESTSSTATVKGEKLKARTGWDTSSSLFGYLPGLASLEKTRTSTSFQVRGVQSLSGNSPLLLVDGIERNLGYVMPEEVEYVTVLKDAAAVALYGYKGSHGVINVITKRGKFNTKEVRFSYDHLYNFMERRPKFVDAYTYANAYNEAAGYEGSEPYYNQYALEAFRTGKYPYLYPNVNWVDETYKKSAATNLYNMSFRGGGERFRYYTLVNLQVDKGFVKYPNMNDGYSTQDKNVRANLRMNLDIDLSERTKLAANVMGMLAESGQPGKSNIWSLIYSIPSAALPVKTEDGLWGGNKIYTGEENPVAQSQAAAYLKMHVRTFYSDLTLKQDFGAILPGLGGSLRIAYDNRASYQEDHTKKYNYASDAVTEWNEDGTPKTIERYSKLNNETEMGTDAIIKSYNRVFNFAGTLDYDHTFGEHSLYTQLRWDYEYSNVGSGDASTTLYRQNVSSYTHYGFKGRYYLDLALVGSAANTLAPGHKWAFSPTVSAAWLLSKEKFLRDVSFIDLLKLRASFGIINTDDNPGGPYWQDSYVSASGGSYNFGSSYSKLDEGNYELGSLAILNSTHEKGFKYNAGLDIGLFQGLNVSLDGYYERRKDIWVSSNGKYSVVLGQAAPYENAGIVDSWGFETGAEYTKSFGNWKVNLGTAFSFTRSKVINKNEAPVAYPNLLTTGHAVGQRFGLVALGLFKDQADIDGSARQTFTTVYPGDIKYLDVNKDGVIDSNDQTAIGYSSSYPEIYYSFHLGAEWKGIGFDAMFQGIGHYSEMLDTKGYYRPLLASTSLSQYYYDNRWTPQNLNALFPRLAVQSSKNNYTESTWWMRNGAYLKLRNVEIYYKFPKNLLSKTRFMNEAKLYVRGIDLLCFDHIKQMDPEALSATDPLTRSVVIGLQVGF